MSHKSLYESSIFTALRDGRVGVQCERSLRFLLFLLDGWSHYSGPRKPLFSKADEGILTSIYFDKFAMFSFRVWDAMFNITRDAFEKHGNEETSITFPCPFVPIPGKHGPGPGRVEPEKGGKPIYLIDILYELQNEGLLNYFEVLPPSSDPTNHKHHKTTIKPGIPVTDEDEFLRGFTRLEREVLFDLRNAVNRLGPSEIRALGTHATHEGTVGDVEREFRYMGNEKAKVTDSIGENRSFKRGAQELLECAEEAWKKSKGNREDYGSGHRKVMEGIKHATVTKAFETSQGTTQELWPKSQVISDLVKRSEDALLVTTYLTAVSDCREHRSGGPKKLSKRVKQAEKQISQKSTRMRELQLADVPTSTNDIFIGNTAQINEMAQTRLIRIVNTL